MKKFISFMLLVVLSVYLCACSDVTENNNLHDEQMMAVLNSEIRFVSEDGEKVLLKDFVWGSDENTEFFATPSEYSFVDFDNDGVEELVVDITPNQVYYMIFHKNNDNIYGFLIGRRALQSIKEDGSFVQTGGAFTNYYCRMEFEGESYKIVNTAIKDEIAGIYEIDGNKSTIDAVNKYIDNWNSIKEVEWVKLH